ncbi:MAG: tRNA (adenosine(37)-N6)-threonylcarbamoyltransferase complex dimerization subunit type 1 TsaB [Candidatus Latescibacteria bacterium]|nr:tRNA (adenosine(37)-N6)-threonylcarbamoyltransferase complex dimerization subunit type 1 TsaB [Candidatus Latescibacterota bacterium]
MGITTTEKETGIAFVENNKILYEKTEQAEARQNELLFNNLDLAFKTLNISPAHLAGIGIVIGPGMFTSLRVGLACAKGLAVVNNIPIKAFKTLQALSFSVPDKMLVDKITIIPVIDIRREELYYQIYQGCEPITEPQISKPDVFTQIIPEKAFLIGSGIKNYADVIKTNTKRQFDICEYHYPIPSAVAFNAQLCITNNDISDTASLVPFYVRSV